MSKTKANMKDLRQQKGRRKLKTRGKAKATTNRVMTNQGRATQEEDVVETIQ
jgi:hypothetical protein